MAFNSRFFEFLSLPLPLSCSDTGFIGDERCLTAVSPSYIEITSDVTLFSQVSPLSIATLPAVVHQTYIIRSRFS